MRIDHIFSMVFDDKDYDHMEDLGFLCDRTMNVEHPGKKFCSFIYFTNNRTYLEFVKLADVGEFNAEFSEEVETHGLQRYNGISLQRKESLKEFYSKNGELLDEYLPNYFHRNYNWKENNDDHLPGWNFLMFKRPIAKHTRVWFTEYEKRPNSSSSTKKKKEIERNPNSVNTFHSVIVDKSSRNAILELLDDDGIIVRYGHPDINFNKLGVVQAIVLKADSFLAFLEASGAESNYSFDGDLAYRIERDEYCFDIIII
ncbi:MAG: hypothetical protein KAG61_13420 [Bacteriovoracaceae bacterium]|nr:hypothetical protein [Bacteriovoracaceae bacterium]